MASHRRDYSNQHIADIVFVYGFCNGNATAAVREYRRRFPNRATPIARTFALAFQRLAENGIHRRVYERPLVVTAENEQEILDMITREPRLSVRRITTRLQLSSWSVWRVLKKEGLHPYHFRRVQDIIEPDYAVRATFCSWLLRQQRLDSRFFSKILWTDEAKFTRQGIINHRNDHLWLTENPHAVRPSTFQHEFSVNMWAGMIDGILLGPIELPPRLNGPRFLEFLQTEFADLLMELPLSYRRNLWLQLDGAPAHFARAVRDHLNSNHAPWIGRGGDVAWPPRSPDLAPLDYFFWGTMKQKVYFNVSSTREELVDRIQSAAAEIKDNVQMVRRSTAHIALRATVCLQNNGGHFEQLCKS